MHAGISFLGVSPVFPFPSLSSLHHRSGSPPSQSLQTSTPPLDDVSSTPPTASITLTTTSRRPSPPSVGSFTLPTTEIMASQYAQGVATPVDVAAARVSGDLHSDSGYGGSVVDGHRPSVILDNNHAHQSTYPSSARRSWGCDELFQSLTYASRRGGATTVGQPCPPDGLQSKQSCSGAIHQSHCRYSEGMRKKKENKNHLCEMPSVELTGVGAIGFPKDEQQNARNLPSRPSTGVELASTYPV